MIFQMLKCSTAYYENHQHWQATIGGVLCHGFPELAIFVAQSVYRLGRRWLPNG